jgi:hypothetical protein
LEISPQRISLAILRDGENGRSQLTTDSVEIGDSSCNDWTLEKLTKLLKELIVKHEIQGHSVFVALGGNACVTRSFFGNNEEVEASCKEVSERASHYLALGRGEKVCCQAETAIDARRKRAWVTVAQREVLELVLRALEDAGLRLGRIEHTLTALCQVAGENGCDSAEPLLMVLTSSGRSDMFISFQGRLLLDYRPSAKTTSSTCPANLWSSLVIKHIKCLRRYLASQLPKDQANLTKICLPATNWQASALLTEQLSSNQLEVTQLDQNVVAANLDCEYTQPSPEMMAAIWMARSMAKNALLDATQSRESGPGDMTTSLRRQFDWSIRTMVANFWPIAASLLLLLSLYATVVQQNNSLKIADARLDDLQSVRVELDRLNLQMKGADEVLGVVRQLKTKLPAAQPDYAVKLLGRSLPKGTWLKHIDIDASRNIAVVGVSYSEDGIYEYINNLKETGPLQSIGLVSSRPTRLHSGPAFEFELKACLFVTKPTSGTASVQPISLW